MEPEPIHAAPVVTITATPEGVRIEGNMAPDLLLAVLWQAIHAVSMQVVQRGLMRVILLKDLKGGGFLPQCDAQRLFLPHSPASQ